MRNGRNKMYNSVLPELNAFKVKTPMEMGYLSLKSS